MGVAPQPAHPLQPRLGRSGREALVRTEEIRLVGRRKEEVDRIGRARFHRDQTAIVQTCGGCQGKDTLSGIDPFIMQADGKALAVLAATGCRKVHCPLITSHSNRLFGMRFMASSAIRFASDMSGRAIRSTGLSMTSDFRTC